MSVLELSHYSHECIESIYSIDREQKPGVKPYGFWISVDGEDDWKSWCEAESFALNSLRHRHKVMVDNSKILHLETSGDLLAFTSEYGCETTYGHRDIDWPRIAEKHTGIIIAPYQWSLRLDDRTFWYYGWDCASGCIWDISAITELIASPTASTEQKGRNPHDV